VFVSHGNAINGMLPMIHEKGFDVDIIGVDYCSVSIIKEKSPLWEIVQLADATHIGLSKGELIVTEE